MSFLGSIGHLVNQLIKCSDFFQCPFLASPVKFLVAALPALTGSAVHVYSNVLLQCNRRIQKWHFSLQKERLFIISTVGNKHLLVRIALVKGYFVVLKHNHWGSSVQYSTSIKKGQPAPSGHINALKQRRNYTSLLAFPLFLMYLSATTRISLGIWAMGNKSGLI